MEGYKVQFASSVGYRDGAQVELISPSDGYVAEVFRDDEKGGLMTFNSLTPDLSISIPLLKWFIDTAIEELS